MLNTRFVSTLPGIVTILTFSFIDVETETWAFVVAVAHQLGHPRAKV